MSTDLPAFPQIADIAALLRMSRISHQSSAPEIAGLFWCVGQVQKNRTIYGYPRLAGRGPSRPNPDRSYSGT